MGDTPNSLDNVRTDAQAFYNKLKMAATDAAVRIEFRDSEAKARQLGESLRRLSEAQSASVKQHLKDAALHFEEAAKNARDSVNASDAQLKERWEAFVAKARAGSESVGAAATAEHR